jgi:hypothetical protein
MTDEEFVSLDEAAAICGCKRTRIKDRIGAGELTTYIVGDDRRKRYVKRRDVEALVVPRPIAPRRPRTATSATAA